MSEFEPVYNLVANVYRQALRDARRGDDGANEWLDICAPDWRKLEKQRESDRKQRVNNRKCSLKEGKSSVFSQLFQCF